MQTFRMKNKRGNQLILVDREKKTLNGVYASLVIYNNSLRR